MRSGQAFWTRLRVLRLEECQEYFVRIQDLSWQTMEILSMLAMLFKQIRRLSTSWGRGILSMMARID